MSYQRFFDGTYVSDDAEVQITTLHNPEGFVMRSSVTGASLTVTVVDALDLFDRLGLHLKRTHLTLTDLEIKS